MPDWKHILRERLAHLRVSPVRAEEIAEELAADLEQHYSRAISRGATDDAAFAAALRELGSAEELARRIREIENWNPPSPGLETGAPRRGQMLANFWQDVRYGSRSLSKSPMFTLVAAVSLALGIGANTTIFTLVNALLLNPLPLPNTNTLVAQFTSDARNIARFQSFMQTSYPNYLDYREQNTVYSGLAAHQFAPLSLTTAGEPEIIFGEIVSGNYFDVLGIQPAAGRLFSFTAEEDKRLGAYPVVVLGHALWKRRFGSDLSLIGKTIELNRQNFTVVGVAPENFRGLAALGGAQMWVPFSARDQVLTGFVRNQFLDRRTLIFNMVGRLKPGVSIAEADAAMKTISKNLEREHPKENDSRSAAVRPVLDATFFSPEIRRDIAAAGAGLMVVVGIVLLIACANVANLLLARAGARQREVAVRISLGASRGRLVRQMLTESLLLSLLAGLLGIVVAYWSRELLWSQRPPFLQNGEFNLRFDGRILLFTSGISLLTGLFFGLVPALQISRPDLAVSLKDRSAQPNTSRGWLSIRNVLVMAQVALSLVALVGAGIFLRSLRRAQEVNPGFDVKLLMTLSFDTGAEGYSRDKADTFYRQVAERVQSLPMVQSAAIAQSPPFAGGLARTVFPEGLDPTDRRNGKLTQLNHVGPSYFETMGMTILRGRAFTENDRQGAPMVAVINEAMAEATWPGQDAIGKRFRCFGEDWIVEIVGLTRTAKYITLGEMPTPFFYFALAQHETPQVTLHVRTKGDPAAAVGNIRTTVQQMDARMPLTGVRTVAETMNNVLWAPRMGASLLTIFGLLALALAALGIHGVVSYAVSQRTQEIGVRMALGATPGSVVALVLRHAMLVVVIGAALGVGGALALTRGMANLLIGVEAADPLAFGATAALLIAVAAVASYLPARRAARIDPLLALRHE